MKTFLMGLLGSLIGFGITAHPWEARAEPLAWITNQAAVAISTAQSQGKLILLLAGRDSCGYCQYMKKTICETVSPPVKTAIKDHYVTWYCQVDVCSDWKTHAAGLGVFSLPLICVIDPNQPQVYLDRSAGVQEPEPFHQRLLQHSVKLASATPPKLNIRRAADGQLEITWPDNKKWKLQSASTELGWQDVEPLFEIKDGQSSYLINPATQSLLFRLAPVQN